jgi:pimeloyl-ACP methyl ester carboxylesterase
MTDPPIVEAGHGRAQGADFAALVPLARRLGISFEDTTPPRHLMLPGAGGVRLHALDWSGDGAPTLFLHGGRLTAQTFDYVCLGLRDRVRAVALDLRGHGDSDRTSDYAFDSQVADIRAILDALAWPRAHLVGMSLGGLIAAHLQHPLRTASRAWLSSIQAPASCSKEPRACADFSSASTPVPALRRWWRLPCKQVRRATASKSPTAWRR